jgi:hypothetical protein
MGSAGKRVIWEADFTEDAALAEEDFAADEGSSLRDVGGVEAARGLAGAFAGADG